jgi:uncharacterized Tic20 family protein
MADDPRERERIREEAPPPEYDLPVEGGPTGGAVEEIPSTQDDRQMALLAHLGGILLGFVAPLVVWLIKKDQSRFVDDQGKEALNFQLTLLIGHLIAIPVSCFTFGMANAAVGIVGLIFGIMGGVEANNGTVYRYPINIRMIK